MKLSSITPFKSIGRSARTCLMASVMRGFVICIAAAGMTGCEKSSANPAAAPAPAVPVTIGRAVRKDMPVRVEAIGYVEPLARVFVRPQVDGQIDKVHFIEGQDVHIGDMLYTIDRRPFEAALLLAKANLEQAEAMSDRAKREGARIERLFEAGQAADREHDQAVTEINATAAEVAARTAEVTRANLDLGYCDIRSPMAGRAGAFMVFPGSAVKKNETDLVMINQIAPISVSFSLPESYLGRVKQAVDSRRDVTITLKDGQTVETGHVAFVDNLIDSSTGMLRLKATFENADRKLWPGAYGTVELTVEELNDVVVVPATTVQAGQGTDYVYIAKPDDSVEYRKVSTSYTIQGETIVVSGLSGGETVVTDGQLRLTPGAKYAARIVSGAAKESAATQPASTAIAEGRE